MDIEKLTPRELEILQLIATGKENEEIAELLFISRRTLKNHRYNLLRKLEASNMAHAVGILYEDMISKEGEDVGRTMGSAKVEWSKETDDKLLDLISKNKKIETIENTLKISREKIRIRLREMGFEGLVDARRVMSGE